MTTIPEQYKEKFIQWVIGLSKKRMRNNIFSKLTLPANQLQALLIKLQELPLD